MKSDIKNIKKIRNILKEVRPELMNKPNVVATGIGYKTVSGRVTDKLAIICSVELKKGTSRLASAEQIPARIQNIPTDVNPTGVLRAFQDPTGRFRPAPGGVSVGHADITAGTLGCLVQKNGTLYILSNNHVLANSNEASTGDPVLQPGPADGGQNPDDQIASLNDFVPIRFENEDGHCFNTTVRAVALALNAIAEATGSQTRLRHYQQDETGNLVDCAIAEPLDQKDVINEILEIGPIAGTCEGALGMNVKKSGRTTGLTTGTIQQIDVTARVNYGANKVALFTDQLMAGPMSQGGDSGSAVLDEDNNIVGLLFAGSNTTTLINRIENVFEAFGASLP